VTARGTRGSTPGVSRNNPPGGRRTSVPPRAAAAAELAIEHVTTVVIGAGHAGLATSRCLAERSIDHVVLERGEVANSWRRERWDSLRLLTPNWQSRLPGYGYDGPDPDAFMTAAEVIAFVSRFATLSHAPVRTHTTVTSVTSTHDGYRVVTDGGELRCRTLVVASGACNLPHVPALRQAVPASVESFTPFDYHNPDQLPPGGVLVVGASATGVQLADEIHRSGRPVTLSVGEHVRLPRTYRGRDVLWWMEASGVWNQRCDEIDDLARARRLPSPQLVGTPERTTLDLNVLGAAGVELVGRLAMVRDGQALFSGGLRNQFALADLKMERLLETFDEWAHTDRRGADVAPPERFEPTRVPPATRLSLDLRSGEIRSIVWATGFRPDYSWLHVPVVDRKGHLQHDGGVLPSPGLYAIGLPVLRRRKSTFICGAEDDARDIVDHLAGYLDRAAIRRQAGEPSSPSSAREAPEWGPEASRAGSG
jgi:putative flavoprotein involved in K+ transport